MCFYRVFQFAQCKHHKWCLFRCSKPSVCTSASQEDWFSHPGECATCLQGVCFPVRSYEPWIESRRLYEANHPLVLLQCRDYAVSILNWSIAWLAANYDSVRELNEPPLSSNDEVQAAIDHTMLQTYFVQASCVECGKSSFNTDTCTACPGMVARAEKTANPATQFRLEVLRNLYGTDYLPEVQAGHYQDLMAQIREANVLISLRPEIANLLVHQIPYLGPGYIELRQETCEDLMASFFTELRETSNDASYGPYSDLSGQVLEVATRVLVCDQGLELCMLENVMRFLAPMLLHPLDPASPPSWEPFYSTSLDFGLYHTVLGAYMGLSRPSDRMGNITMVLEHDLDTKKAEHKADMDRLSPTKEMLLTARVELYSTPLPGPPEPDWICCVCITGEPEGIIQLNQCRHVFHEECFVHGALHADGDRARLCHYCRQHWDGIEGVLPGLTSDQDWPWSRYGL